MGSGATVRGTSRCAQVLSEVNRLGPCKPTLHAKPHTQHTQHTQLTQLAYKLNNKRCDRE